MTRHVWPLYAGNSTTARKKVPKMARIEMQALNALSLILGDAMPGHSASAGDVENAYAGSATNIPVRNAGCHDFLHSMHRALLYREVLAV